MFFALASRTLADKHDVDSGVKGTCVLGLALSCDCSPETTMRISLN